MDKLEKIKALRKKSIARKVPNVTEENGNFLYMLVRTFKPKKILEIGTANGISTLYFALGLEANGEGKIFTVEPKEEDHREAKSHVQELGFDAHVSLHHGRLQDVLPTIEEEFDMVFIDGMKKEYAEYFLVSLWKTHQETIFIFDDVIKFRHKMESLFEVLEERKEDFEWMILPTDADDGVLWLRRKAV